MGFRVLSGVSSIEEMVAVTNGGLGCSGLLWGSAVVGEIWGVEGECEV